MTSLHTSPCVRSNARLSAGIRPRFQRKYALLATETTNITTIGVAKATTVYAYIGLGQELDQQSGLATYTESIESPKRDVQTKTWLKIA